MGETIAGLGGTTKDASALSPLSRIISLTVDGEVSSVGLLVREFLTLLLDVVEDATAGLVELLLLLLRVAGAMVRIWIRGLIDALTIKNREVLGKLERLCKFET